jgi:hypothetical protein
MDPAMLAVAGSAQLNFCDRIEGRAIWANLWTSGRMFGFFGYSNFAEKNPRENTSQILHLVHLSDFGCNL